MCYRTHRTHKLYIRKVRDIPKAFGLEQMSGGSNKYLRNKSRQRTDKVILEHGCSPSPIIKRCFAFAGKAVIPAAVLFQNAKNLFA